MSDYLTDDEFRDLQERSALIAETASSHGWMMLADRAAVVIGARQQRILQGKIDDYTEYQKEISFLEGAMFILQLPDRVKEELDRELRLRLELEEAEAA